MKLHLNWGFVADGVMGGLSTGTLHHAVVNGRPAAVLQGQVSLENNGGFVQMATYLHTDGTALDASAWDGIALDVCGNGQTYDLRLRTDQLTRPWQSFRTAFSTSREWQTVHIPFATLTAHKTDSLFNPTQLRRIGVLAIGRAFDADVAVAAVHLYKSTKGPENE
ncbi:Complex I intermediate-associated protein 30 (CIA30) [Pseudorhodobacter antarcticus]|uniref:Complex I intermediate-associated protein 30 (CIA30) n=1 Tax=Pseudorhodobacter antarcticus TaxID=1077947 RepID=A0A1H8K5K9_9RHOB|nr:CIA30 family protein [Pseudorhodobacter antarcticus]SEN88329.1 Complex I intermediate-associated protein 30 (CIA30) [Pseudorhodobacter antarcticus]